MNAAILAAILTIHPLAHPFSIRTTQQPDGGFSVDLPIVGHVHGSTTFSTALDITNNTAQSTDVEFFYTPADGSAPRSGVIASLPGFDNVHFDDFLQGLASAGLIASNQAENSFGSLLLTFTNPAFHTGTEATAVARVFSPGAQGGTVGLSYRARPIETNGAHSLSALIRSGNGVTSNIGIESLGVDDQGKALANTVTVRLTFYDPSTGTPGAIQPAFTLAPGQVVQLNDVFRQFGLTPNTLIVFVDETAGTGQIRGYAVTKDIVTNDGSFVFMQESQASTF